MTDKCGDVQREGIRAPRPAGHLRTRETRLETKEEEKQGGRGGKRKKENGRKKRKKQQVGVGARGYAAEPKVTVVPLAAHVATTVPVTRFLSHPTCNRIDYTCE
jgi:hypothetical protein